MDDYRILALGSPHGDDQVAWLAARQLGDLNSHVELIQSPWEIVRHLRETRLAILLDACQCGSKPGVVHRWTGDTLSEVPRGRTSTHAGDLTEAVQMAAVLGETPEVVVLGLEVAVCEQLAELSDTAREGARSLARHVWIELQDRSLIPVKNIN